MATENAHHALQTPDSSSIGDHDQDAPDALLRPVAAAAVLGVPLATLRRARWQRRGPRPIYLSRGVVRYAASELRAYLAATAQTADPVIAVLASGRRRRHPPLAQLEQTWPAPPHAGRLAPGTEAIDSSVLITLPEAVRRLAVSAATIARWRHMGRLGSGNWLRGRVSAAAITQLARGD